MRRCRGSVAAEERGRIGMTPGLKHRPGHVQGIGERILLGLAERDAAITEGGCCRGLVVERQVLERMGHRVPSGAGRGRRKASVSELREAVVRVVGRRSSGGVGGGEGALRVGGRAGSRHDRTGALVHEADWISLGNPRAVGRAWYTDAVMLVLDVFGQLGRVSPAELATRFVVVAFERNIRAACQSRS